MDEESFPRYTPSFSLDLLKNEKIYTFPESDKDRYVFLKALFTAKEFLFISYGHLSKDEGKPLNSSPLVEELRRSLDAPIKEHIVQFTSSNTKQNYFFWPEQPSLILPEGEINLSISELVSLSRHPWEFFLKKTFGIYLENKEEPSFSLQKGQLLRAN